MAGQVGAGGGGRGMKAIAAHFRYISKNGRLEIEDERGQTMRGKDTLRELADALAYWACRWFDLGGLPLPVLLLLLPLPLTTPGKPSTRGSAPSASGGTRRC